MDPYLEAYRWKDFHTQLIVAIRQALRPVTPYTYDVFSEDDVFVHEPTAEERRRKVAVLDVGVTGGGNGTAATAVARAAGPTFVAQYTTDLETEKHRWVEIRDRDGSRLVTAIELLSPSNKRPGGTGADYLRKRNGFLDAGVNFVEIDLLRGGTTMPLDPSPAGPYYAAVRRAGAEYGTIEVWDVGLRDPLPTIPVPLSPPDADVPLDLQAVVSATYDAAAYGPALYDRRLDPPLGEADAAWADEVLKDAGVGAA